VNDTALAHIGLPVAAPGALGLDAGRLRDYLDALRADIAQGRMPGAVVLVARRGHVALFEALGRLRGDTPAPMVHDAIFRIRSMTKPIVSVAALRLVEQGRLGLDDPLAQHLPGFAQMTVGLERRPARAVATVHDLLRHTAGFTYGFWGGPLAPLYQAAGLGAREVDNAGFAACLATLPLAHEPGTAWQYSHGTDLLGRLVEVVSGQPLGQHLRDTLFVPLRMADTGFHVPPPGHSRLAEPHALDAPGGQPVAVFDARIAPRFESGGAGLVSTAADYARFMRMLAEGGALDGARVLGRKTVAWMTADHLGDRPRMDVALPPGYGFGLGVAVRTAAGLAPDPGSMGSYGWSGGDGTIFFIDPAESLWALLLVQTPSHNARCWSLFRQMIHASVAD
jgi:CubicO group peptidase (beta-lactamase class C family)